MIEQLARGSRIRSNVQMPEEVYGIPLEREIVVKGIDIDDETKARLTELLRQKFKEEIVETQNASMNYSKLLKMSLDFN